ncbi:MAG: multicopper oxidase domain-containing protein, partial [Candidatus Sericytochromatia bacterium]|nr:multicopper oxidase domain-containing protein [Candidatus Sericytochromatia bacterium]
MKIPNLRKLSTLTFCTAIVLINSSYDANSSPKKLIKANSFSTLYKDFSNPLVFPEVVRGINTVSLTAQKTTLKVGGNNINVLGYHNGILGPTIVAEKGEQVNINFKNNLDEETNIHWHGLIIPANMDGHPDNIVKPSNSFNYSFKINQRAGMYWYHPHPHNKTAKQAYLGLAGVFLVTDPEEKKLNLPSGAFEVPLVIQDKRLNDKSLKYNPSKNDIMTGFMGKDIMVNGIISPFLNVSTGYYRLRVLNGSNARVYNLAFSNNSKFTVIGSDGGLLVVPEAVNSLMLSPGERADILIDFSTYKTGTKIYLQSNIFSGSDTQGKESFKI